MTKPRYIILDAAGMFENLVVWDGTAKWSPPSGHTAVLEDSAEGQEAISAHVSKKQAEQEVIRAATKEA